MFSSCGSECGSENGCRNIYRRKKMCCAHDVSCLALRSCFSSSKLKISKLHINLYLLPLRFSCSRLAFFFSFIVTTMCGKVLPSLAALADISLDLCVDAVSDISAAVNVYVGTEVIFGSRPRTRLMSIFVVCLGVCTTAGLPSQLRGRCWW